MPSSPSSSQWTGRNGVEASNVPKAGSNGARVWLKTTAIAATPRNPSNAANRGRGSSRQLGSPSE